LHASRVPVAIAAPVFPTQKLWAVYAGPEEAGDWLIGADHTTEGVESNTRRLPSSWMLRVKGPVDVDAGVPHTGVTLYCEE
jgi:hypothetical protein